MQAEIEEKLTSLNICGNEERTKRTEHVMAVMLTRIILENHLLMKRLPMKCTTALKNSYGEVRIFYTKTDADTMIKQLRKFVSYHTYEHKGLTRDCII